MVKGNVMEDLETRVVDGINNSYLITRKSSELLDAQGRMPLAMTEEVRQIAEQFLANKGVDTTK